MTPDALWSFEFIDNEKHHGGGVAVFNKNKILGGNNGFTYIGGYSIVEDEILIKVDIKRFFKDVPGIYKDEFSFTAKGKYHKNQFIVTGSPDDGENFILAVQCTRQSEIIF
jgi:hypothetical protein